ncbi:unnamed protein product [Lasius platythorax]|uniref:Uncharacterized protein n=1 Tax=Lasius platythorax TaxID=488582 RepID=A0AAV2MYN6_9HYME
MLEEELQASLQALSQLKAREELTVSSTPRNTRSKRKAKTSPDAITPSSEELATDTRKIPKVILRKVKERSRKKKPRNLDEDPDVVTGETSSTEMSAESDLSELEGGTKKQTITKGTDISASADESDVEYTGTEYLDPEYTKKLRFSNKSKEWGSMVEVVKFPVQEEPKTAITRRKKKDTMRVWSSTKDNEDDEADFCPEDLKIMGATAIGAIGIDCLKIAESERKKQPQHKWSCQRNYKKNPESSRSDQYTYI